MIVFFIFIVLNFLIWIIILIYMDNYINLYGKLCNVGLVFFWFYIYLLFVVGLCFVVGGGCEFMLLDLVCFLEFVGFWGVGLCVLGFWSVGLWGWIGLVDVFVLLFIFCGFVDGGFLIVSLGLGVGSVSLGGDGGVRM